MSPIDLPEGRFAGIENFQQHIRDAITAAEQRGWREMVWSDADFAEWPLREKAVIDALNQWARGGRKLTLLAHRFDSVQRLHHRFVAWRIQWDHIIECRVSRAKDANDFPCIFWTPDWTLQRLDAVRHTGMTGTEPERRLRLGESLQELQRQSSPGFPASVLGL